MSGGRYAFFRLIGTALAIIVVTFGLAAALGGLGRLARPSLLDGRLILEVAARMAVTLEPVLISFLIASALGFVLTRSSAPAERVVVAFIVTGLRSLPVFVCAIIVELFFGYLELPIGGCGKPCTLGNYLGFLATPVVVLTTYQLPYLVTFFDRGRPSGQGASVAESSTVSGVAKLFVDKLPSLISAALVVEIIYGWAGEGRLGLLGWAAGGASAFGLVLIFNALVVLMIRCIVDFLVQRRKTASNATR